MSVKIIPIIAIKVDDNSENINSIPIAILDDENNIPMGKPVINCKKKCNDCKYEISMCVLFSIVTIAIIIIIVMFSKN